MLVVRTENREGRYARSPAVHSGYGYGGTSAFGQEPKRGNFVVVDFNFTNNGSQAVTLDRVYAALLDSQGRESEPDPDTFGYIDPNKGIFLENVNPRVTRQGEVIFTVAQDAQGFRFRAGDAAFFSSDEGYVDLGF